MLTKQVSGERKLPYASSVGCPYACNYCTDTVFYKRRFNAYSAKRVVREVTALVAATGCVKWRCWIPTFWSTRAGR